MRTCFSPYQHPVFASTKGVISTPEKWFVASQKDWVNSCAQAETTKTVSSKMALQVLILCTHAIQVCTENTTHTHAHTHTHTHTQGNVSGDGLSTMTLFTPATCMLGCLMDTVVSIISPLPRTTSLSLSSSQPPLSLPSSPRACAHTQDAHKHTFVSADA